MKFVGNISYLPHEQKQRVGSGEVDRYYWKGKLEIATQILKEYSEELEGKNNFSVIGKLEQLSSKKMPKEFEDVLNKNLEDLLA